MFYVLVGLVIGTILAVLHHFSFFNNFVSILIGILGLLLALGRPYATVRWSTLFSLLICTMLITLPFYWLNIFTNQFSAMILALINAFAITAFYLHFLQKRFSLPYLILFHAVWDTFVNILIAALFSVLCWVILFLTGELFASIRILFLRTLFDKSWFEIASACFFVAMGLYVTTQLPRVTETVRAVLSRICYYLFIPLSAIGIVFLIAYAFSAFSNTLHFRDGYTFLSIAFLSTLFLNGLYQDGHVDRPYPTVLLWIARVFLWVTPIFSLLTLYTIYFPHPMTVYKTFDNVFHYTINTFLLFAYNIAYAFFACKKQKPWMHGIEKSNIVLALVIIVITQLTINPHFLNSIHSKEPKRLPTTRNARTQ